MATREREPIPMEELSEEQRRFVELVNREGPEIKAAIDQLLVDRELPFQVIRLAFGHRTEKGGTASALPFDDIPLGGCYCNANGGWYCC